MVVQIPNPVDVHIGGRLRERRLSLRLTQIELGERVGIAGQQIQKYERGENRISISRMWALARVLKVSMMYFYEELEQDVTVPMPMQGDLRKDREAQEFVRNYFSMPDPQRRQFFNMLSSVANHA